MYKHLQKDIEKLKNKIITMGGLVEDRLHKAVQSIHDQDAVLAQEVIKSGDEIDQMEVEIEEHCLKILALYQPVAIDLRFIIAVLKINSELERVGDIAINIAERSVYLAKEQCQATAIPFDIASMASKVEGMLSRAIDSLVRCDAPLAHRVRTEDDEVDRCNREMYVQVKSRLRENPDEVSCLLHAISVGRHLERIGDLATNIAEDVIYLVEAEIVRHTPEVFTD